MNAKYTKKYMKGFEQVFVHRVKKRVLRNISIVLCLGGISLNLGAYAKTAIVIDEHAKTAEGGEKTEQPVPSSSQESATQESAKQNKTTTDNASDMQKQKPRQPVENYILVGIRSFELGRFEEAYVAFRIATEVEKDNPNALLGLGRSQMKLRLYDSALKTLSHLVDVHPQNLSGYVALAQTYQQQYIGHTNKSSVKNNLDSALETLKEAEVVANNHNREQRALNLSKVFNERGNTYRLLGKVGEAIESFKSATLLNPDNSLILFNLGDMYQINGDTEKALKTLQKAVITDPRDAYNRAYYANLLAATGKLESAQIEAAQASRMAPTNAYAQGQYGVVSYLAGDKSNARRQLKKAIELEALRFPEFYYYLGRMDLEAGHLKSAREQLTKASALGSQVPEYAYYLGLSYEKGNKALAPDRIKAKENYERALKIAPEYAPAKEALERIK